ncbi:hypothetical protein BDQ12DRAFT_617655 [Crucibulum laeve]|uniref:Cohesin loading factor-domain-containing protein n=1 Tax=Crucibulum laeve TaxID=68775 RepID=A0A5C3LG56_9AGAR|nr:hypothetical protein BDQ12DRAFT_617655 [Crucibulum laeve]
MSVIVEHDVDDNPRPLKRQRRAYSPPKLPLLEPISPENLLLALPKLLAHPPAHHQHARALSLSRFALQRCLNSPSLESDMECRAWTALAEVGFRIGLEVPGIENEVEKALTKALLIAQKHPSLRRYKPHLTFMSARISEYQSNHRYAQNTLRRLHTSFILPSDPPHITYSTHLMIIANITSASDIDLKVLSAIQELENAATRRGHQAVANFAAILRLRILVQSGKWERVGEALKEVEGQMELGLDTNEAMPRPQSDIETVLLVHVLITAVIFHTYAGDATQASSRLKRLHELLDGGALDAFGPSGIVQIPLPNSPPFYVQVTHPRVLFSLVFLVSSIAKRDPVGRKPKKRVFAVEGLAVMEREEKSEISVPVWASVEDVRELETRMSNIKADFICELIGVSIMRSEFDAAEQSLCELVAHTRTHSLFSMYSARITLMHAQLAHSLGKTDRAIQCYKIATHLSRRRTSKEVQISDDDGMEDLWVNTAARAGELWARIGVLRARADAGSDEMEKELATLSTAGVGVIKECEGLGGTLQAVGEVLQACLTTEFLKAKTHLRRALGLATSAQDNHLRALVLALISSHYFHTSSEHAHAMLATSEQLAAGLGAQPRAAKKGADGTPLKVAAGDGVGNAQLRLWVGERLLDMNRWAGEEEKAQRQSLVNEKYREAVKWVEKRAGRIVS